MSANLAALRAEHVALLEFELPRLVEGLKALDAQLIVLVGSYAHGRRDLFTDLDLLAVIESDKPFLDRLADVRRTLSPKVATDLFIYTPAEFEEMKQRPFVKHALATGTALYAR
jgi:predicted nucleotidyltransferase